MRLLSRVFGRPHSRLAGAPATLDVQQAYRRQAAGAVLIDVRQPDEWRQGHALNATLVPLGSLLERLADVPRERDVLLICRSGNRSGAAQRHLLELGYRRVFNVSGGMNAWAAAGLSVSR